MDDSDQSPATDPFREWLVTSPIWDVLEDLEHGRLDKYRKTWFRCEDCGNEWQQYTDDDRPVTCNRPCQSESTVEIDEPVPAFYVVDRGGPTLHAITDTKDDGDRFIATCGDERHRLGPRMMWTAHDQVDLHFLNYERLCDDCGLSDTLHQRHQPSRSN